MPSTDSSISQISGGGHSGGAYIRKLRDSAPSPQLQPKAEFGVSSSANVSQEHTDFTNDLLIARSGDADTDEAQHLQDVGFVVSTKYSNPWRTSDSGGY